MNTFSKLNLKVLTLVAVVFALGLFSFPRIAANTRAEACSPLYTSPVFNPYPVSASYFAGQIKDDCTDFPTLAVRNVNQNQYLQSISAQNGDELLVQAYVHNGATPNDSDENANLARNINASFTNTGSGFSVSLTAENVSAISGNVSINIPANSTLEVVSGSGLIRNINGSTTGNPSVGGANFNVSLGNQKACFQFARFIQFKVRVVGQNVQPTGTISANAGQQIGSQCLRNGSVSWSSNAVSAQVYVRDLVSGNEKLFAGDVNGYNRETPWLIPNRSYSFILYNTDNGQKNKIADYTLNVPDLNCSPQVVEKSFTLTADSNLCVGQQTRFTISGTPSLVGKTIVWSSTKNGVPTGENNSYGNQVILNSSGLAFWSDVSSTWQASHVGAWTKTATIDGVSNSVNFQVRDCSTPAVEKNFTLTADSNMCVGQQTRFTISGTPSLVGKTINWTSTFNGENTQENNSYAGQVLTSSNGLATWSDLSSTWVKNRNLTARNGLQMVGDVGAWTKTATIDGISKTVSFTVRDCATPQTLVCSPGNQTVNIGQAVNFSANGGAGSYSWTAYGSNTTFGSGQNFSTTFSSPGVYTVTVGSEGKFADCSVQVSSVTPPAQLVCSPTNQTVSTGQNVSFTATGGSSSYVWSAPSANTVSGTGSIFNTSYPASASGQRVVTVTSGSQTANCNVTVNQINPNTGTLSISKTVRNVTQNSSFAKTVNADSGNRVAYQVLVTAQSNAVNNVTLNENLPSNFSYIAGTLRLDSNPISDSQINSVDLGTMSAGQSKTVYLEGYANSYTGQCQTVITNTASASGNGTATVSDSATVYVNQNCGGGYSQMSISKLVRNSTSGNSYFSESVNAKNGDRVQFEITVRNTGTQNLNNVRIRDYWNTGLALVAGSVSVDGSYSFGNDLVNNDLSIGSLSVGQQKRITLETTVFATGGGSIQNTARASADNASTVSDDAWVFINSDTYNPCPYGCVQGGNVNLSFQKRAVNETKNADATTVTASREDYITYTLTASNNGNAPANNFIITDDISGVLNYADMADNGGGIVSGNTISFPGITVPAYGSVSKSFKVRIKYNLASNGSYTMNNTYGNTVSIRISNPGNPQVLGARIAPKTGADTNALAFAGILTLVFAVYNKRKVLMALLLK